MLSRSFLVEKEEFGCSVGHFWLKIHSLLEKLGNYNQKFRKGASNSFKTIGANSYSTSVVKQYSRTAYIWRKPIKAIEKRRVLWENEALAILQTQRGSPFETASFVG